MKNTHNDPSYASVKADLNKRSDKLRFRYKDSDASTKSFLPKK